MPRIYQCETDESSDSEHEEEKKGEEVTSTGNLSQLSLPPISGLSKLNSHEEPKSTTSSLSFLGMPGQKHQQQHINRDKRCLSA